MILELIFHTRINDKMTPRFLIVLSLLLTCALGLSACNTLQGVGEDLKQGGQALDRAVK